MLILSDDVQAWRATVRAIAKAATFVDGMGRELPLRRLAMRFALLNQTAGMLHSSKARLAADTTIIPASSLNKSIISRTRRPHCRTKCALQGLNCQARNACAGPATQVTNNGHK